MVWGSVCCSVASLHCVSGLGSAPAAWLVCVLVGLRARSWGQAGERESAGGGRVRRRHVQLLAPWIERPLA